MLYNQFTGTDLVIFQGNIHCILIIIGYWVLVLEEDWVREFEVRCVLLVQKCFDASAVEGKDADQVSPVELEESVVEDISFALLVHKVFDIVDCGAVINTLQQKELRNVCFVDSDLVDVFEYSLSFHILVLALNTDVPFI